MSQFNLFIIKLNYKFLLSNTHLKPKCLEIRPLLVCIEKWNCGTFYNKFQWRNLSVDIKPLSYTSEPHNSPNHFLHHPEHLTHFSLISGHKKLFVHCLLQFSVAKKSFRAMVILLCTSNFTVAAFPTAFPFSNPMYRRYYIPIRNHRCKLTSRLKLNTN